MLFKKKYPIVECNEAGLEVYREEENGFWVKREYDEQGRQTYWASSSGGWTKHEFDDAGNTVYYANSDGFWYQCEYDENNNIAYYKDSTGKVQGAPSVNMVLQDAQAKSALTHDEGHAHERPAVERGLDA